MKIVVLDDSLTVRLTIQALLEELHVPEECIYLFGNGKEALQYIAENGADIIFSDINMPGMDGFEFVGKLLNLSHHFVSTLFIVSADEHMGDIANMKMIGAKRFIRKPINSRHFNHFVAPEIAKAKGHETHLVKKADAMLNTSNLTSIDYDELAQKMGIKVKHIPRLIESFLQESRSIIHNIASAIEERDYKEIEKCAHSLKGSAGNMQFQELYEIGKLVEVAAKSHEEGFDYRAYCNAFKQGIDQIASKV